MAAEASTTRSDCMPTPPAVWVGKSRSMRWNTFAVVSGRGLLQGVRNRERAVRIRTSSLPRLRPGAKRMRHELRAHAAGDEGQALVRRETPDPVERSSVDERNLLRLGASRVDHESEAVIIRVIEGVPFHRQALHGGGDSIGERGTLRCRQDPDAAAGERISMLLESIERGTVRRDVFNKRVDEQPVILPLAPRCGEAEDAEVLRESRTLRKFLRADAAV